jgi:hypothetical protein
MVVFVTQPADLSNVGWVKQKNQYVLKVKESLGNPTHTGLEIRCVT